MAEQEQPTTETEYKAGRPFLFTKPDELKNKIEAYFDTCDPHKQKQLVESGVNKNGDTIFLEREVMTEQIPYTVVGLARAMGVSRRTLLNYRKYEHYTDEISPEIRQELILTIEDAYYRVEEFNEKQLHKNGLANGIKFNLTNNFDWVDKQVVETESPESALDALDDPATQRDGVADEAAKALEAETPPEDPPKPPEQPAEAPNDKPGPETPE